MCERATERRAPKASYAAYGGDTDHAAGARMEPSSLLSSVLKQTKSMRECGMEQMDDDPCSSRASLRPGREIACHGERPDESKKGLRVQDSSFVMIRIQGAQITLRGKVKIDEQPAVASQQCV